MIIESYNPHYNNSLYSFEIWNLPIPWYRRNLKTLREKENSFAETRNSIFLTMFSSLCQKHKIQFFRTKQHNFIQPFPKQITLKNNSFPVTYIKSTVDDFENRFGRNIEDLFIPFQYIAAFWRLCSRRILKTLGQ